MPYEWWEGQRAENVDVYQLREADRTIVSELGTGGGVMRYRIGRLLQVVGLLIAPIGMAGNLLNRDTITEGHVLLTLFVGALVFGAGHWLQGCAGHE